LISQGEIQESIQICDSNAETDLENDDGPPAPGYFLYKSSRNGEKKQLKDDGMTYLERKESSLKDRVSINNAKIEESIKERSSKQKVLGLYPCTVINDRNQRCKRLFSTLRGCNDHMTAGVHQFPNASLHTRVFLKGNDEGGCLQSAKFKNRSQAIPKDLRLELVLKDTIQDWEPFKNGCYNKPSRKKITRMSEELRKDLIEMYEEGERTKAKYSADQAREKTKTYETGRRESKIFPCL